MTVNAFCPTYHQYHTRTCLYTVKLKDSINFDLKIRKIESARLGIVSTSKESQKKISWTWAKPLHPGKDTINVANVAKQLSTKASIPEDMRLDSGRAFFEWTSYSIVYPYYTQRLIEGNLYILKIKNASEFSLKIHNLEHKSIFNSKDQFRGNFQIKDFLKTKSSMFSGRRISVRETLIHLQSCLPDLLPENLRLINTCTTLAKSTASSAYNTLLPTRERKDLAIPGNAYEFLAIPEEHFHDLPWIKAKYETDRTRVEQRTHTPSAIAQDWRQMVVDLDNAYRCLETHLSGTAH